MSKPKDNKISETVNLTPQQRELADSLAAFRQLSRGEVLREAADRGMRQMAESDNKILVRQNLISKRVSSVDVDDSTED